MLPNAGFELQPAAAAMEVLGSATVRFPESWTQRRNPLAGQSFVSVSATLDLNALSYTPPPQSPTIPQIPAGARVRVYVFVTPAGAQAAVAALDRILYPGIPAAVLLVAAVALLATRRALRPVEAIRARTAAVSATDPRERVVVPDTGDEIARLAATINATLGRLDDAARAQRRFVADAAHELRSPLTTLLATLEIAETYPDRANWPQTVAAAADQARRIQTLAEDLLLLARLDAAAAAPTASVDLAALARAVATDRADRSDPVPVRCQAERPVVVLGDPGQLERLLCNLVDNAVRHARTHVTVRVRADGGDAVLDVQDDGLGIPAPDRERIFERFTRLDDARSRRTGGSGLGLAIARDIAERHQGALRAAEPASGEGALLIARLPLTR